MKIFILFFMISNICFAGDFYYYKGKLGWAGPYEDLEKPAGNDFGCKALIDTLTNLPFDKTLMKTKSNKTDLDCGSDGFAKLKTGSELTDAKKVIDDDKVKETNKNEVMKNIDTIVMSLKAIVCKDHPSEDLCK